MRYEKMRKTTKKLLTGSLAICMVLGFPVNMSGAQAANNLNFKSCITVFGNYQIGSNEIKNVQKEDTSSTKPRTEKESETNDSNVKENNNKSNCDTTNNKESDNNDSGKTDDNNSSDKTDKDRKSVV